MLSDYNHSIVQLIKRNNRCSYSFIKLFRKKATHKILNKLVEQKYLDSYINGGGLKIYVKGERNSLT